MDTESGLVFACTLNGDGGAHALTWEDVKSWSNEQGPLWVHLDRVGTDSQQWLKQGSGLDPLVAEALLEEETRPRIMVLDDSLFLTLRGVNLNPGENPEDMISIRLYIDANRIVSVRHRPLMTIRDIRTTLDANKSPKNSGDCLTVLTDRRMV